MLHGPGCSSVVVQIVFEYESMVIYAHSDVVCQVCIVTEEVACTLNVMCRNCWVLHIVNLIDPTY